jgi:hypothetical protein
MEWILRLLAWGYLAGCTAAIAAVAAFLLFSVSASLGWKASPRNQAISFLAALLLVCGSFAYLGTHPMVTCPPEYEAQFTPQMRQSLKDHAKGIYSFDLPSPGYLAAVEHIGDGCVRFRTHYLFLGSTVSELGPDGFDLIKPLCKP